MDYQTSFVGLVQGLNDATNNLFFGLALIISWVILILVLYNRADTADLMIGSGFIYSIIAGLSMGAGLIPAWTLSIPIAVTIAGILFKYMGGR